LRVTKLFCPQPEQTFSRLTERSGKKQAKFPSVFPRLFFPTTGRRERKFGRRIVRGWKALQGEEGGDFEKTV
jgi:hypothetical protein